MLNCLPYQQADRASVLQQFPDSSQFVALHGRTMHYMRTGFGQNLVVFVHGSPGTWEAFASFLVDAELTRAATLVSVDRLGFGESDAQKPELSLRAHELAIAEVIRVEQKRLGGRNVVLVGHSFAGPIIARIAADKSCESCALVFVGAAVDPALERIAFYQEIADWRAVRWLLPRDIDHANQEILPLKSELESLRPLWKQVRGMAVVLQGDQDSLVDPANAEFLRIQLVHLPAEIVYLKNVGHFIPWQRPEEIKSVILRLMARQKNGNHQ